MKNLEVFLIAILSTTAAVFTWLILNQIIGGENSFISSYYSIIIFPPIFVALFLLLRKYKKIEF